MLAAATYLSWLGSKGLHELSMLNFTRGQELEKKIIAPPGFTKMFTGVHFNEFVIQCPDAKKTHNYLLRHRVQGGLLLQRWNPELTNCMLFGITELHSKENIEQLISCLMEAR